MPRSEPSTKYALTKQQEKGFDALQTYIVSNKVPKKQANELITAIIVSVIQCNKHPEQCTCDSNCGDDSSWDDDYNNDYDDGCTDENGDLWCYD